MERAGSQNFIFTKDKDIFKHSAHDLIVSLDRRFISLYRQHSPYLLIKVKNMMGELVSDDAWYHPITQAEY